MSTYGKGCYLTTYDLNVLDRACEPLVKAFGRCVYLVGSAMQRPTSATWTCGPSLTTTSSTPCSALAASSGAWSASRRRCTCAPRPGCRSTFRSSDMTEANALDGTPRNPLGFGMREFAGGGDATRFIPNAAREDR
jgi:hypothetical protein